MNKVDKLLEEVNLTKGQLNELQETLQMRFAEDGNSRGLAVAISDHVRIYSTAHTPMSRKEALRMAHWLIDMLEEEK